MTRLPAFVIPVLAAVALSVALPALASDNCKPHSLFTPMPGYHVYSCEHSDFDAKEIPIALNADDEAQLQTVEGIYEYVIYEVDEDGPVSSPLKILRNHLSAAQARGATVLLEPGARSSMLGEWVDIQEQVATLRMTHDGREYLVHLGSVNSGDYYAIASVSPVAMEQSVSASEMGEQFDQHGVVSLQVHFDTGKATIRAESSALLDQAAALLRDAGAVKVEVAGHTDDIGSADANLELSQQRADSVRTALLERDVAGERISARGYGATRPVAGNDSEEGRAKNRRVELVKR